MKKDFKFIKEIGKGSFSKVYKAIDLQGKIVNKNELLAIKVIDKLNVDINVINSEKKIFKLINNSNSNNKNIIKIYEYFEEDDYLFICMEYINGYELLNYVNFINTDEDIKNIISQMINAVQFLHEKNISHGDIKLENFLITDKKRIILIDFGLSTIGTNPIFIKKGTAMYAAPEMVIIDQKGRYNGKKIDMWALGTVIYILKYKTYPFLRRSLGGIPNSFKNHYEKLAYLDDNIHHPKKFRGNPFIPIINGLICKDVNKRFNINEIIF